MYFGSEEAVLVIGTVLREEGHCKGIFFCGEAEALDLLLLLWLEDGETEAEEEEEEDGGTGAVFVLSLGSDSFLNILSM